jgi:hypothetical protein
MTTSNRPENSILSAKAQALLEKIADRRGSKKWAEEDPERLILAFFEKVLESSSTKPITFILDVFDISILKFKDRYAGKTPEEISQILQELNEKDRITIEESQKKNKKERAA